MRKALAVLVIMLSSISAAPAQVSFGFSTPDVSIGVNLPVYPELVRVPGYPVYYAPQLDANYFFYDGLYWVFDGTSWYASSWYNGPWHLVVPDAVPLYLLRVPVRYYREPPRYFRGWAASAPPRWGVHWGNRWERNHRDWDRWDRRAAPAPAPLPTYQRSYAGNRYPSVAQQRTLESRNYHYQPRDRVVQQHVRVAPVQNAQAPRPSRERAGEQARDAGRNARPAAPPPVTAQRVTPRSNAPRAVPSTGEQRTPPVLAHRATPQAEQRTPPAMAHRGPPQAPQRTPPALAHRAAPQAEQRAAAERSLQQAGRPPSAARAASPAMAHRAAPPTIAQHRGPQGPQARAEAPQPEPRPAPQAHARGPQGKAPERAAGPGNSAHARGNDRQDRPG